MGGGGGGVNDYVVPSLAIIVETSLYNSEAALNILANSLAAPLEISSVVTIYSSRGTTPCNETTISCQKTSSTQVIDSF